MAKAIWNDQVIAESDETIVIEGNHYFPPHAIKAEFFESSKHRSFCPWKGQASYYNLVVDGEVNTNAAWYYETPSDAAGEIKAYIAFWRGVSVEN